MTKMTSEEERKTKQREKTRWEVESGADKLHVYEGVEQIISTPLKYQILVFSNFSRQIFVFGLIFEKH